MWLYSRVSITGSEKKEKYGRGRIVIYMTDPFGECKRALLLGNSQFVCLNISIERMHGFAGSLQSCELENSDYSDIFKNLYSLLPVAGLLVSTSNMKLLFCTQAFALACILPQMPASSHGPHSQFCLKITVNCTIEILEQVSRRGKLVWLKDVHNTIIISLLIWMVYLELVVFKWN